MDADATIHAVEVGRFKCLVWKLCCMHEPLTSPMIPPELLRQGGPITENAVVFCIYDIWYYTSSVLRHVMQSWTEVCIAVPALCQTRLQLDQSGCRNARYLSRHFHHSCDWSCTGRDIRCLLRFRCQPRISSTEGSVIEHALRLTVASPTAISLPASSNLPLDQWNCS